MSGKTNQSELDARDHTIDIARLRTIVNDIFDHMVDDQKLSKVTIEPAESHYWEATYKLDFDPSQLPEDNSVGDLIDDWHFIRNVKRGQTFDAGYNLVHVYPLLRYLAHKVGQ